MNKKNKLIFRFYNYLGFILNIFFYKLSKPSLLKILQWKKIISLISKKSNLNILEFGSGRSTIFFLNNLNLNKFDSVNPVHELKYTNIVRNEIKKLKIKKNKYKIINCKVQIKKINKYRSIEYKFKFLKRYDFIYIDGPNHNLNTNLIFDILTFKTKTKYYFLDGRKKMRIALLESLKSKKIKFKFYEYPIINLAMIILK